MSENNKPLIYLAGPFFNEEQLALIKSLEKVITDLDYNLFSPRLGENALEMNKALAAGKCVSDNLRRSVFGDNVITIKQASLLVAVVDDRDTGTIFEWGYAFASHIPLISVTNHDYGMNLMLAHSIVGHCKGLDQIKDGLQILRSGINDPAVEIYGQVLAEFQAKYRSNVALLEGPTERDNNA